MNDRLKLAQVLKITALAIVLLFLVVYVPFFSILILCVPVPYAIISAKFGLKYATISMVVSFFIFMMLTDMTTSTITVLLGIIPGIIIGNEINQNKSQTVDFKPIYKGIITFALAILILIGISKFIFNINLVDTALSSAKEVYNISDRVSSNFNGYKIDSSTITQIIDNIRLTIPSLLILYSTIATFIVYYITIFVLKKLYRTKSYFPEFVKFHLPGNALIMVAITYLITMFLGSISESINTHHIMINLQVVFIYLFGIQGISVFIFFLRKILKNKFMRIIAFVFVFFFMSGLIAMGIIGVLDSMMDLRKIRTPKGN